ncbi:2651_t:CDS:2 [Diversispora eburnea]|uniref:protein-serine/threonine phosphatase n=1 Tax=Diversispora eburnea TaxID=1213867 RepID=A0A9N8ZLF4_9GLOM|nr:2651_t:CDS:2 [Diversispora eburnea]
MGQTLSEPVREKHSAVGHDERLLYASSAMQGWRISMEDAHTTLLQVLDKKGFSFFGVYDGHGGQNVAKYSGDHLHGCIVEDPDFGKNLELAIKNGFLRIDDKLRQDPQFQNDPSGCTAVTAVITPTVPMSNDHKPVNKAGGFVEFGRVNGNLALSRAIGDFEFKQNNNFSAQDQIVTAFPDVKKEWIDEKTEFLVLACDVISFIRDNISKTLSIRSACEELMERCLAKDSEVGGIGCDNMTVVIVAFLNGKTVDQWYSWMQSRYENVGPKYPLDDIKPQKNDEYLDVKDDDIEDFGINTDPSNDDYTDADLENQNSLTIDDLPSRLHRENSIDSMDSMDTASSDEFPTHTEKEIPYFNNSIDNKKEKKNGNASTSEDVKKTPLSRAACSGNRWFRWWENLTTRKNEKKGPCEDGRTEKKK